VVEAAQDLRSREALTATVLGVSIIVLGFFPAAVLDYSSASVDDLVTRLDAATAVAAQE
jgi:NADH:ubiquinone oxidoreductase subunit 4 (subunit M)